MSEGEFREIPQKALLAIYRENKFIILEVYFIAMWNGWVSTFKNTAKKQSIVSYREYECEGAGAAYKTRWKWGRALLEKSQKSTALSGIANIYIAKAQEMHIKFAENGEERFWRSRRKAEHW